MVYIEPKKLEEFLVESKLVTPAKFKYALKEAQKNNKSLGEILVKDEIISNDKLLEIYAKILRVEFIDLIKISIPKDILLLIPEPLVKKHQVAAFKKDKDKLYIAMTDPKDLQTIEFIKKKTELEVIPFLTNEASIISVLKQYKKSLKAKFDEIIQQSVVVSGEKEKKLEEIARDLPIIRIVDTLLEYAIFEGASDIHIEPMEKEVIVRYRIDGILHDVMTLPKAVQPAIVARIKVLSNLKIDEHRLPQDGRFKKETDEYKIAFRVSILPVFDGEKIVMRLLDESARSFTLEQLGFQHSSLEIIKRNIQKPNGMLLATGPTGSGKTTTLYTILNMLNTEGVNISTIEDPVEYHIPRVNQTQVNPRIGLTFANGLRSLLRQDPDIMMVGEIRDFETAEMAIHSALTGHIVLSTLHTNNASGALPRLIDMGAEPFLIASTVNAVIGQRLVRKICTNCIEEYKLDKRQIQALKKFFNIEKVIKAMQKERVVGDDVKNLEQLKFYKGRGCEQCGNEGYKGRIGIYEILEADEDIQSLIVKKSSTDAIQNKAIEKGMITMLEDGLIKSVSGVTTVDEVLRVTQE